MHNPFSIPLVLYFTGFRPTRSCIQLEKRFEQFGALKKFVICQPGAGEVEFWSEKSLKSCLNYFNGAQFFDGEYPVTISTSPLVDNSSQSKIESKGSCCDRHLSSSQNMEVSVSQPKRYSYYLQMLKESLKKDSPLQFHDALSRLVLKLKSSVPERQINEADLLNFVRNLDSKSEIRFDDHSFEFSLR